MHVSNWNCADMPKKKPHRNPVSVRLVCVCVCINERRLICLCAHFAHLCMDRSWPETRLEPSNLLQLSPSPCCAKSSPNAAAESLQTGAGDIKTEGRRAKKSGNRRGNQGKKLMSKNNHLVSKDLQPSHQEAQVPNLSIVSTPCTNRKTMHWQKLQISAQFTQPLISTHRHTQYKSVMYLYSVFEVF